RSVLFRAPVCFFIHPSTAYISSLSLHDALPIFARQRLQQLRRDAGLFLAAAAALLRADDVRRQVDVAVEDLLDGFGHLRPRRGLDRKSTRLNSSHVKISYAVFCLKKKITILTMS